MTRFLKVILTGALALVQLAALMIPLFGLTYFIREFGGDNDDGTFTPTAARRWKAALILAISLATWAGLFYATIRAPFKMWSERTVTSSKRRN